LHPALPETAAKAHILPQINTSLLSVGQLCDGGCEAHFTADTVTITHNGNVLITGSRSEFNRLWHVDLQELHNQDEWEHRVEHFCNAINPSTMLEDRIAYYHACCFTPVLSTWCKAIDAGRFTTWPELTSKIVR
jgi:hypothetical protein